MVAAETAACFLSGFCFGHAVFHAFEVADALAGFALGQVDTAARDAVTQVRLRKHNIAADGVAEAKVFIKGRVSEEDDAPSKLICEQVIPFAQTRKELWLQYPDKETYLRQEGVLQDILKVSEGVDEVIIYCKKEKAVKRLPKGWNVTADEVLLSRLTNYLGESCVKVIEKPIESVH